MNDETRDRQLVGYRASPFCLIVESSSNSFHLVLRKLLGLEPFREHDVQLFVGPAFGLWYPTPMTRVSRSPES